MSRIIIICEGETEQQFCNRLLCPYFWEKGKYVDAPLIKRSNGGIVRWCHLKRQIETTLINDRDSIVTLMIDYYGLYEKYGFPGWDESVRLSDKYERMLFLEGRMKADLDDTIQYRFVPYIQLHEFEGLLFCDLDVFRNEIPQKDLVGLRELEDVIASYPNPEMINTDVNTSPSHRLARIIKGYNKIVYGNILAESIGLRVIRSKCPGFDKWISLLEESSNGL